MRPVVAWSGAIAVAVMLSCASAKETESPGHSSVKAFRATDALPQDPDDPAIWINKSDPAKSLVLGTMKVAAPEGGLAVFTLDGKLQQVLKGLNLPNNVDVEYGLDLDAS